MSAPPGSSYQFAIWEKFIDDLPGNYCILVREKNLYLELNSKFNKSLIVYCRNLQDLDQYISHETQIVFYVNNACNNAHMVRKLDLHHILLLHGDSEKPASYNPMSAM